MNTWKTSRGAAGLVWLVAAAAMAAEQPPAQRPVASFDCTKEYPPESYFASGDVRVTESAAGRYREAGPKPLSRFGYRFAIRHVGKPHLAVVHYPDDKPRFMGVMDGTCYDLTTGVFTGRWMPLSGTMRQIRLVFWPRWEDCSIVLANLKQAEGEPAAAASIEIFELDTLPALEVPGDHGDGSRRELGFQFEDPCGVSGSEGAMSRREWLERLIAYARYTGQKTLVYPIVWYSGPWYPSAREPVSYFEWATTARDRRQYLRWTTQPEDWVAELLKRFEESGMEFRASLTLLRLGSLMKQMNIDLDSIKAGRDTINNMLFNDLVQSSTEDWTMEYDVRNFAQLVAFRERGKDLSKFPWAYGEVRRQLPQGAVFNPLHPVVQKAILGLVQEIVDRYGRSPAFKGITFNVMWPSTFICFGSLKAGYDDYTVGRFEKETGIRMPVDGKAPDRFSKRYAFLTGAHREEWIKWRCANIHELLRHIRDMVVRGRPDRSVTLNLYAGAPWLREGGLDLDLLRNEPGIEVVPLYPAVSSTLAYEALPREIMTKAPGPASVYQGTWFFNDWTEIWGKYTWFSCDPKDEQTSRLAVILGKPAEGICRTNCAFAKDGFWWDTQLRIVPTFPGGDEFMKHYAEAVGVLDARRITSGGLILDKAHSEPIRRFALAYRALPAKPFQTVGNSINPVAVRTLVDDGRRYCYLVNQERRPVEVILQADNPPGRATDLATGREVDAPGRWPIVLGPYELRSFGLAGNAKITGFSTAPVAGSK